MVRAGVGWEAVGLNASLDAGSAGGVYASASVRVSVAIVPVSSSVMMLRARSVGDAWSRWGDAIHRVRGFRRELGESRVPVASAFVVFVVRCGADSGACAGPFDAEALAECVAYRFGDLGGELGRAAGAAHRSSHQSCVSVVEDTMNAHRVMMIASSVRQAQTATIMLHRPVRA